MRWRDVVFACVLAGACASPPPTRPPLELAPFLTLRAEHFPGAANVLTGFAAPDDDPQLRVGDAALLGLEVHRGSHSERLLLLLEVVDLGWKNATNVTIDGVSQQAPASFRYRPAQSFTVTTTRSGGPPPDGTPAEPDVRTHTVHPVQLRLQRSDAAGTPQRTSTITLFEEPLATGWWPYTQQGATPRDRDMAFALTMSLQELAGRDPVLQELLFRVVDEPSLWSVATHLGVNVVMRWDDARHPPRTVAVEHDRALGDEVRSTMIDLVVNGDSAAWVTLLVARPHSGSRACGGLVGAIAQHASESDRLAVVRLLATRRGPAPVTR